MTNQFEEVGARLEKMDIVFVRGIGIGILVGSKKAEGSVVYRMVSKGNKHSEAPENEVRFSGRNAMKDIRSGHTVDKIIVAMEKMVEVNVIPEPMKWEKAVSIPQPDTLAASESVTPQTEQLVAEIVRTTAVNILLDKLAECMADGRSEDAEIVRKQLREITAEPETERG